MTGTHSLVGTQPRRRILFVGTDADLARQFGADRQAAAGWEVSRARTVAEALKALETGGFCAVVAESQLPEINGVEFLNLVMNGHPQVTRILRFRLVVAQENLSGIGQGHHLLREPCQASNLLRLLERMDAVQKRLPNPVLPALIGKMRQVPSPPQLYFQVLNEMGSPDASVEQIGRMIARDPAATAKVLQLANSAAFGRQIKVNHPTEAVGYLGFEMTKALLLVAHSFAFFEEVPAVRDFLETFWRHSMAVGRYARQMAQFESADPELGHQAFTAGLLHDLGKLVFAANLPREFGEALALAQLQGRWHWEIESQLLGASHAELGAYLLALWNLPSPIVDAVAWHHCPTQIPGMQQSFTALTAVHVADVLEHELRAEWTLGSRPAVDLDYLQNVGCADRLADWQQQCQPVAMAA